ncbi:MAG: polysaccharide pyruvyl transferase family protein [Candidatus Riflebacteria bacterium]|nr:polysaccharide pyruvyl transferase family protein [Candidatus Riflebacteria bacterium]
MKAGIITHYDVHNHGAQLQMYALATVLKELGYDETKALRFKKNYDFMGADKADKKYNISLRSIPTYLDYLYKNGLKRTLYNIVKRKNLSDFRKEYGLVGEYYSEANDLDVAIIGSDEIFSIEAGLNSCFYGMGVPCKKIISYAASFGPTDIDFIKKHKAENFVEAGLKNIDEISVRDLNSHEIVKHYTGKDVPIVCDPVLLYGFSKEINSEDTAYFKRNLKEKYCIVYSYDNNMNEPQTVEAIKEFAKKNGLKVYSVAYFHKWCDRNIQVSPLDIFKWFVCAEMVFTDTFHGTVLSIVCNTQFVAKIRGNSNKLGFLLEEYNLRTRLIEDFNDLNSLYVEKIDYSNVNKLIVGKRKISLNFLRKNLVLEQQNGVAYE